MHGTNQRWRSFYQEFHKFDEFNSRHALDHRPASYPDDHGRPDSDILGCRVRHGADLLSVAAERNKHQRGVLGSIYNSDCCDV
jgi:hypothetical protein